MSSYLLISFQVSAEGPLTPLYWNKWITSLTGKYKRKIASKLSRTWFVWLNAVTSGVSLFSALMITEGCFREAGTYTAWLYFQFMRRLITWNYVRLCAVQPDDAQRLKMLTRGCLAQLSRFCTPDHCLTRGGRNVNSTWTLGVKTDQLEFEKSMLRIHKNGKEW